MGKGLLGFIFGMGLTVLGVNAFSQSTSDNIPEAVKAKAANYLSYASSYCGTVPDVSLVGEKVEKRENRIGGTDNYPDKVLLYQINNACDWSNVPTHFTCTYYGKEDGTFETTGFFGESGIISREKDKPVMPKEW